MRFAEVDRAINSPLCNGPRRKADAVFIANCRPYHDDTDRAQEHIAYCIRNGITEPMIRADMGQTFGGVFPIPNCPLSAQDDPQHIADGYASGVLDYRKRIILGPWAGCEFDRFCHIGDMFVAARLRPVVLFNTLGEAVLDLWAADPTTETGARVHQCLTLLGASPRAIARNGGQPIPVDNPRENWAKPYPYLRKVMNTTCGRIMADSPLYNCQYMVANSCAVPINRDDGRLQPACDMADNNQISHFGYYSAADASSAACVESKYGHGGWRDFACNLNCQDCQPDQVASRDRFGPGGMSILWADELSKVEAVLALTSGTGTSG